MDAMSMKYELDNPDVLKQLNAIHQQQREEDSRLSARIESFELAFRMQARAPEIPAIDEPHLATQVG